MDITTKTGTDAAKTASTRIFQKIAGAAGDFIGHKIGHKITSAGKTKKRKRKGRWNKFTYHQRRIFKLLML